MSDENHQDVQSPPVAGKRVGVTLQDGALAELFLLPGEFQGPWEKARAWAAKQGGELPSRIDALVLFQHARAEFKEDWYWIDEEVAGYESSAWCQYFYDGGQGYHRKATDRRVIRCSRTSAELRARAVRRVPLL